MKNKIKAYRAMNDLMQKKLAQALGITHQTILAIEKINMILRWDLHSAWRNTSIRSLKYIFRFGA
jgi:ribosome-binding protein aMBF1 (putative translation factor)